MPFPRLTWAGLLIATFGWGLLLSYPLLAPAMLSSSGAEMRDPARFILIFGENAVVTGLAIAMLGGLERTLRLLGRIAGNSAHLRTQSTPSAAASVGFGPVHTTPSAAMQAQSHMLMPQRSTGDVVTRGALNGRDYILFRDGSVVVETLLGSRRFPSITEAQEFIGAN